MNLAARVLVVIGLVASGGSVVSGEDAAKPDGTTGRPNIILVSLDTVRADHLGCYGYERRPVSPALDAFAAGATRYARAQATSPWTLPSHASVFTGLYPFEHGAHTVWVDLPGAGAPADGKREPDGPLMENVRPLADEHFTLAEAQPGTRRSRSARTRSTCAPTTASPRDSTSTTSGRITRRACIAAPRLGWTNATNGRSFCS